MSRPIATTSRPQLALQSYLDALLQEAAAELAVSDELSEFETAVMEEQVRDARLQSAVAPVIELKVVQVEPSLPVVEVVAPPEKIPALSPSAVKIDERPSWGAEPFECLLFDVAGLTLAVPLVCLGSIYPLDGKELTPIFGQPEWFLGMLPGQTGNLKVLDTARWVMPERYKEECRDGLQYVISVEGFEWGLAVHQVNRSIRLDPREVKWRSQRSQRPWLAGTVIDHMCALLDVEALAGLISGGSAALKAAGRLQ
jgi:purine-binding chemotaxis protein CheW